MLVSMQSKSYCDSCASAFAKQLFGSWTQVETLLTEIEGTGEGFDDMSGEALDSRCRTLERLASEVSRLSYYAAKGKVSPAKRTWASHHANLMPSSSHRSLSARLQKIW